MSRTSHTILEHLAQVDRARHHRASDPDLAAAVRALKSFQHRRLEACYTDLLASPRYGAAARFFLDDLYGPWDFTQRDAQFARIVPALVRLFPAEIVSTVETLAELHALSEHLDDRMALVLRGGTFDDAGYARAWREVGEADARLRQIALMRDVGEALERYTRRPALRQTLRLMRMPARAAGLLALHGFLERGFDTFRRMNGATEFLDTIVGRETCLARRLSTSEGPELAARHGLVALATRALVQLP